MFPRCENQASNSGSDRCRATRAIGAPLLLLPTLVAAANIQVTTLADVDVDDAACSLREAIVAANTDAAHHGCVAGTGSSDRILLTLPGVIGLQSNLPAVTESVAIRGLGATVSSIDGIDQWALLKLGSLDVEPAFFLLEDLELDDGLALLGGAIELYTPADTLWLRNVHVLSSTATAGGGGISSAGHLHLERSWVAFNEAGGATGGGGIIASRSISVVASTISFNASGHTSARGGGLFALNVDFVHLVDSTISGNSAAGSGGGLAVFTSQSDPAPAIDLRCQSSTITRNEAGPQSLGVPASNGGGILLTSGAGRTIAGEFGNCLIAANDDGATAGGVHPDFWLSEALPILFDSQGFNLVGDHAGVELHFPIGTPNANGDFVGEATNPLDPRLDGLTANGGPTLTHAPLQETPHPVVDQGSCAGARVDQRGYGLAASGLRIRDIASVPDNPRGDGCDIGAVEAGTVELPSTLLLADGFESGTLLFWSSDLP